MAVKKKIDRYKAKLMYASSDMSYDAIRKEFGVSKGFIVKIAKEDGWLQARELHKQKAINRAVDKSAEMEGDKLAEAASQLTSIRRYMFDKLKAQMDSGDLDCSPDMFLKLIKAEKEMEERLNPSAIEQVVLTKPLNECTKEDLIQALQNNGSLIETESTIIEDDVEVTANKMIEEYKDE